MPNRDYVPGRNAEFLVWLKKAIAYAVANSENWGVAKPSEALIGQATELSKLVEKCEEPTHSSLDIHDRNALRKVVEKSIRNYLQGMVMHNENVTDHDREMMGLPVYDSVATPVGSPVGLARAEITYPARTQLMLLISHVEGTPSDPRANYGYRIYYGVFAPGETLPVSGNELRESRFTRLRKELFEFDQTDSGKTAVFCIRYENHKGKAGAWGPIFSAVIP